MKILIVRFSTFGDLLLTTPLLRNLRNKYPHAEIHYLAKQEYIEVLKSNPNINRLIGFEGDLRDTVLDLLAEKYDYLIDLQNSLRSANIAAMLKQAFNSNIKIYRANNNRLRFFLYKYVGINLFPDRSRAENYLKAAKKLGIQNDGLGLDYAIPESEKIENKDLPLSHSAGYISFVVSTERKLPRLSIEHWKELCSKINYPIILQGDTADEATVEEIRSIDPIRIYNSCGKFNLAEQADIIRNAKLVVALESPLMHIAAVYKRKVIALMERKRPAMGMFPYYGYNNLKGNASPDITVLTSKQIKSKIDYCKELSKIDLTKVVVTVQQYLNR